jgi:hypothetical protein
MYSTSMANAGVQPTLERPEWFVPVPNGPAHYVAAVQDKPGELKALRNASAATWMRLTPLVEVVGPRKPPPVFKAETVSRRLRNIAAAVGQHPCFLDILRLRATHAAQTRDGTGPVLSAIYAAARRRGLAAVPVLRVGDRAAVTGLIRDAVLQDGRGVAVRYPLLNIALVEGQTPESLIKDKLAAVETELTGADLLIDLGYLSPEHEIHAEDTAESINELVAVGEWRSVVLLGTSMPRMLGGVVAEGTVGELPRREWALWSALRDLSLPRLPTYGDYVIQHPEPPRDEERGGPGMRANIRYTTASKTLVARGRGPITQEGREQYRGLCRMLTAKPEFAGRSYSWGDAEIADCASGATEPGWKDAWRGVGSSHHIRLATEQVNA